MKTIKLSLLIVALLAVAGAQAQKAGDTIVSLGWARINPNASLSPTNSTGSSTTIGSLAAPYQAGLLSALNASAHGYVSTTADTNASIFNGKLSGATADIDNTNTVTFSILRMITDDIGAELTLGAPPKINLNLTTPNGTTAAVPNAATARALTPAILGKYFFGKSNSEFRPYLGLGVTHATFSNVSPNLSNSTVSALASVSASLSSSWAPVYNAGVIYNFDEKWSLNASVSYIPLKTNAVFVGPGASAALLGNVTTTTTLKINPTDYIIRLGYKF